MILLNGFFSSLIFTFVDVLFVYYFTKLLQLPEVEFAVSLDYLISSILDMVIGLLDEDYLLTRAVFLKASLLLYTVKVCLVFAFDLRSSSF